MQKDVMKIPIPGILLKNDWYGIVYIILTSGISEDEHKKEVMECIEEIENDFDNKEHYTVSLVETRRELVYQRELFKEFGTLVSFRVRDSY